MADTDEQVIQALDARRGLGLSKRRRPLPRPSRGASMVRYAELIESGTLKVCELRIGERVLVCETEEGTTIRLEVK